MKKIIYSPGYGSGFATWADSAHAKALAEDAQLVAMVEDGSYEGSCTWAEVAAAGGFVEEWRGKGDVRKSLAFVLRCIEICGAAPYLGDCDLEIAHVDGAYRIDEYDGFESVVTSADFW